MNNSKTVVKQINGKDVTFYPLPMAMLFECNHLGDAISSLVANLFADTSHDVETEETSVPIKLEEGSDEVHVNFNKHVKPISPSLASMRLSQKKDGIKALIDALTDRQAQTIIAKLISRSARDEKLDPETLMEDIDIETFADMFGGVREANKGVFEQLGKWLRHLVPAQVVEKVKENLGALTMTEI